jgi:hypothetical protein
MKWNSISSLFVCVIDVGINSITTYVFNGCERGR